jgi:hypothetical protein
LYSSDPRTHPIQLQSLKTNWTRCILRWWWQIQRPRPKVSLTLSWDTNMHPNLQAPICSPYRNVSDYAIAIY